MKTQITVDNVEAFGNQVLGYNQVFGTSGEVIGYQLWDTQGHMLGGGTDDPKADLTAITKAYEAWPGVSGFQLAVNVRNLKTQTNSGYVSLSEALAFVFPAK
jgi:hypothetical protein